MTTLSKKFTLFLDILHDPQCRCTVPLCCKENLNSYLLDFGLRLNIDELDAEITGRGKQIAIKVKIEQHSSDALIVKEMK